MRLPLTALPLRQHLCLPSPGTAAWGCSRWTFRGEGASVIETESACATGATDGSLRLSADVLARIYACTITRWNDPLIVALNPNARWPHTPCCSMCTPGTATPAAAPQQCW